MRQPRMVYLLGLLLIAVLLISACAAPAAAPAAPAEGGDAADAGPVTLTWAFWGSPEEKASHERVAEPSWPSIRRSRSRLFHEPWGDYFTKVQALWASGDSSRFPTCSSSGRRPATRQKACWRTWIRRSRRPATTWTTTGPALLESASYDGSVYGFPRDIGFSVLYYNKDLFDAAGVEYPTEEWTWDDLTAAAEALTVVDANGRVTQYGLAMEGGKYAEWINQNMGSILDDMRNPVTCTLDQPRPWQAFSSSPI